MLKHRLSQVKTCRTLGGSRERIGRQMSAEATLKALAEPRRQQILRLVRATPRSVGEIAEQVDITQQAVSQHLQVLKDAGLVAVLADGTRRLYAIRPEGLESLDQFLAELWPTGLRRLKAAVESDAVQTVEAAMEGEDT